jgi:hypothetical protein
LSICVLGAGNAPICPAETWAFCACRAAVTSAARQGILVQLGGSSQMRIAYCEPKICVSPTPETRERILQLGNDGIGKVRAGALSAFSRGRRTSGSSAWPGHLQALLLHFLRQERRGRLQLVLHLHLGNVGVRALLKGEVIVTVPAEDDEDEK